MNEDKVIELLLENREIMDRMENAFAGMATKNEFNTLFGIVENMATDVKNIREEQIALVGWLRRHDQKIEKHDKDIARIKTILKAV